MSPSIWTRCAGRSRAARLECRAWRVVEGQHLLSTRHLVDSAAEHDLLERLLDETKPPVPREPEFAGLHYLLFTPFRYPPLRHGSRFGTRQERSLWYGAEALVTAQAEYAYYRRVFFAGSSATLLPNTIAVTAFRASVATARGIDLTRAPFEAFRERLASRTSYAEAQQLGGEMRAAGIEAFRYHSARGSKDGVGIGLFTPAAFAGKSPLRPAQNWQCTVTVQEDVEYRRHGVGAVERVDFPRATFLVDGKLPHPAV
jgi:RES domain